MSRVGLYTYLVVDKKTISTVLTSLHIIIGKSYWEIAIRDIESTCCLLHLPFVNG